MTIIYVDGSCINNGLANAISAVGVYFGPGDKRNYSGKVAGNVHNSNIAELEAIRRALIQFDMNKPCDPNHKVIIRTDSQYAFDVIDKALKAKTTCSYKCSNITPENEIVNFIVMKMNRLGSIVTLEKVKGGGAEHTFAHNLAIAAARA